MLDPTNRTLYSTLLKPPAGYSLDRAVSTSYSMDPMMALMVPLQLAFFDMDKEIHDILTVYEAIRRVSSKLDIFIDKGMISNPSGTQSLYVLLEPILHEVRAPRGGAFHPKCWLLRYINDATDEYSYRFVVLSRNLTFDKSWDICCCLDDKKNSKKEANETNKPIIDLFTSLLPYVNDSERKTGIENLLDSIKTVDWEYPKGVDNIDFILWGVGDKRNDVKMPEAISKMIISPFCSDSTVIEIFGTPGWKTNVLISRLETLDSLSDRALNTFTEIYTLGDEYFIEEDDDENEALEGLHAKIFAYNYDKSKTVVYLGSTNATDGAMKYQKNVEFMVRIEGSTFQMNSYISETYMGFKDYLVPYTRNDIKILLIDENEKLLDDLFKKFRNSCFNLYCKNVDDETSELFISIDNSGLFGESHFVYAWPITLSSSSKRRIKNTDENSLGRMGNANITGLIAFSIEIDSSHKKSFVLNLPVANLPENRENLLIQQVIGSRDNFLRYIYMLLSNNDEVSIYEVMQKLRFSGIGNDSDNSFVQLPLLEEMIKKFTVDKESLYSIKNIMDKLADDNNEIIPDDFKVLWAEIQNAMEALDG